MVAEELVMLATAGGAAVAGAAGTDAWQGLRRRLVSWFGRGDSARGHDQMQRLDESVRVLEQAQWSDAERRRQADLCQALFTGYLRSLDEAERAEAVAQLRRLLEVPEPAPEPGPPAVGGNTFHGPVAFQTGDGSTQHIRFGNSA